MSLTIWRIDDLMKVMIKMLLLTCCLFLCPPVSAEASGSLAGGIVTEIPRQMFLTKLPATEFDVGSDPAQLDELTSLLDRYTIIVTCGGETYELPMELSWNRDGIDFLTPGSYQLIGTILAPDGCTFADGVLTRIVMPIVIKAHNAIQTSTLDMLHNAAPLLVGNMLCTGSYDSLRETEEFLKGFIQAMGAYNANGDSAPLELDHFDDSRVILDTPGEYTIEAHLRLPAEFDDIYTLDPAISVLHIPVRVSDPENFNIWMSHSTATFFYVKFLPRASQTIRIFRTQSASPLNRTQLKQATWTLCDTLSGLQTAFSVPRPLPSDTYFYFYLDDGTSCSDYLCIVDDGRDGISFSFEGGRDGGDAIGPSPSIPQISKPPFGSEGEPTPSDPSTEPAPAETEHPSETEPVLAADSIITAAPLTDRIFSDISADITGKLLLTMMEKGSGTARISNDGITATLDQEALFPYSIREDSEIKVTLSFIGDNQFVLNLTIDETAVQEAAGTKIMVPYGLQEEGATPYLVDQDNQEIPADAYDPDLQVASFTVEKCGTYTIRERGTAVTVSAGEISSEGASAGEISSEGTFAGETSSTEISAGKSMRALSQKTASSEAMLGITFAAAMSAVLGFFFYKKRIRR